MLNCDIESMSVGKHVANLHVGESIVVCSYNKTN